MMSNMFCFQCQETMHQKACTVQGMCGKRADCANLQDALIKASQYAAKYHTASDEQLMHNLFMTITNANFSSADIKQAIASTYTAKPVEVLMKEGSLQGMDEDIRSLQELLLYGLKGLCAYMSHALVLGYQKKELMEYMRELLVWLMDEHAVEDYIQKLDTCGEMGVMAMALLDEANTQTYGNPEITTVSLAVGKRPGILVSGHDLHDLEELLQQSTDSGVDIYTHGEMLPAHYYPAFKKYPHFKGNYGNAWWKQQEEFEAFQGVILMTTNCIVPVQDSYRHRIYTTGVVGYDGIPHIEAIHGKKDFSALIKQAKTCPAPTPLESGTIVGGFAHAQLEALQDSIVKAVKTGAIRQFIVMAGCAKYRYLKLNLGDIQGIPRVLDAGQCNDSYSLALIAIKLKEAFALADINELPITYNIAWYEQKAVIVLLALLHLGIKHIHLGPTLPAFLSPNVVQWLVKTYGVSGIQTPDEDLIRFGLRAL